MFAFVMGVCEYDDWLGRIVLLIFWILDAFTIRAVSQDDFEDVQIPDAPQQSPRAGANTITSGPVVK